MVQYYEVNQKFKNTSVLRYNRCVLFDSLSLSIYIYIYIYMGNSTIPMWVPYL